MNGVQTYALVVVLADIFSLKRELQPYYLLVFQTCEPVLSLVGFVIFAEGPLIFDESEWFSSSLEHMELDLVDQVG